MTHEHPTQSVQSFSFLKFRFCLCHLKPKSPDACRQWLFQHVRGGVKQRWGDRARFLHLYHLQGSTPPTHSGEAEEKLGDPKSFSRNDLRFYSWHFTVPNPVHSPSFFFPPYKGLEVQARQAIESPFHRRINRGFKRPLTHL